MGQECQQCNDTYDKINFDIFILKDKVIGNLSKQTDEIGERLKRIEENPVQIVKRT